MKFKPDVINSIGYSTIFEMFYWFIKPTAYTVTTMTHLYKYLCILFLNFTTDVLYKRYQHIKKPTHCLHMY